LPAAVGVAATDPTQPAPDLWRGEVLPNAIAARQAEFAAGRHAARVAMARLGLSQQAIPIGRDRAPIWPAGVNGSITHSATLCLAAVTMAPLLVGIDLEPATPLNPELWDTVLIPQEIAVLSGVPNAGLIAKLIFSAKESAYKAQYACTKTLFGFDAMHITLSDTGFTARFTRTIRGFSAGTLLHGRHTVVQGHVLTAVTV
jgi:4'-phosphopantetheinyl transferase EntD